MERLEEGGILVAPEEDRGVYYIYEAPVRLWH